MQLLAEAADNHLVEDHQRVAELEDGDGIELVQKFDTKTGSWSEVAGMLIPRSGSAACVLNGFIYVVGGWHASTENTNKVERYDVARNLWEFVACMNERRYRPGVATLGGKMFVLGAVVYTRER